MNRNELKILHISKDLVGGIGTVIITLNSFFKNFKIICYDDFQVTNPIKKYKQFKNELIHSLNDVEILHFHGAWTPHLVPLKNKFKLPTVVSPHGALDKVSLEKSKLKKLIVKYLYMKKAYSNVNCIHALTVKEAHDIRNYGIKNVPIFIIPNGIDTDVNLEIDNEQRNVWLKKADGKRIILSLSRLHTAKGIDILIDAFSELNKNIETNVLFIVGSGDVAYIQHLQRRIETLGLENSIFLLGELVGVMKNTVYDVADIFVLPSYNEGFGITVLEAYRQNVPVITTTATPFSDIKKLNCGWYINPNTQEILTALKEATSLSKSDLLKKGKIGNEWIEKNYSIDKTMEKYEIMYRWLLGESDTPEFIYKG